MVGDSNFLLCESFMPQQTRIKSLSKKKINKVTDRDPKSINI
jgi:hypothetical protein